MTNMYGKTWWGSRFLQSLSNIDYENRLGRGRSYASKGAVQKIEIVENSIHAKVKGSKPSPYKVDIIIPPFFDPELSHFINRLAAQPVIISKMLNRELDPEVLTIAEEMGLKVFPKQWTDFKMQCNCPDWAVPCKHLAAVIYKISAEIDNNPFIVFELHRVNLPEELKKRGIVLHMQHFTAPSLEYLYLHKNEAVNNRLPNNENAYLKLNFSELTPIHAPLAALLQAQPAFYPGNSDFKDKYITLLNRVVKNAIRVIQNKTSFDNFLQASSNAVTINHHTNIRLHIDNKNKLKIFADDIQVKVADFLLQMKAIPALHTADYQPSVAALHTALFYTLHLLANGAVIPEICQTGDKKFIIRYVPALLSKPVRKLTELLETILPDDILVWENGAEVIPIHEHKVQHLISLFIAELLPFFDEAKYEDVFLNLFFKNEGYPFKLPGEEALSGGIMSWLQIYSVSLNTFHPAIVVDELPDEQFKISVNIIDHSKPGLPEPVSLEKVLTIEKYANIRYDVLSNLTRLSKFISGLDMLINSNGKIAPVMSIETFSDFLMNMTPAIRLLDIEVMLPKSLQEILHPKASLKIKAKDKIAKSFLQLDKLLDFDWQVAIGDTVISESEFYKLMKKSSGLIKFKKQYIYVSENDLQRLQKHFSSDKKINYFQLLKSALSGEYNGAVISLTDEITELIKELTTVHEIALPHQLQATLRPYQHRGFSWMYKNAKIGFGSVIADDMGLGKTVQVITTLLKFKEEGLLKGKKVLIVAPTGLLTNWQYELQKFAPVFNTKIYHGTNRKLDKKEDFDILISSYGIIRSDADDMKKYKWHTLVIDEAQNIKNTTTFQTKAIKSIKADYFIAMSGTPVENRLSELWSILDYSNKGLFGSLKDFNEEFGIPIQIYNDIAVADKLKKVSSPFVLRRLKSDKTIISDLPDKIEMDSFAMLCKEQSALYEKTLQEAMAVIEAADVTDAKALFVRQGLVLQMILALKQICNHPAQFLKNKQHDPQLSGKVDLLFDKLDSIAESGEKVLVFTQFSQMGELLKQFITERYGEEPMFYHGGCSIAQRNSMVDRFQNNRADKIFILSLKAAGTGLNLTAANHVIHFDLWWNPAVEAQATDRAYRIGQKSNVMVHRFITKNTFEERINEMIVSKKELANMTVNTGENWIGNLNNKELRDLFAMV